MRVDRHVIIWVTRPGRGRRGLTGNRWLARRPRAVRSLAASGPRAQGLHPDQALVGGREAVGPARARASRHLGPGRVRPVRRARARKGFTTGDTMEAGGPMSGPRAQGLHIYSMTTTARQGVGPARARASPSINAGHVGSARARASLNMSQGGHVRDRRVRARKGFTNASTEPEDVVWEPFGGLFTATVASLRLGRQAFAAEIDSTYFHYGVRRLTESG